MKKNKILTMLLFVFLTSVVVAGFGYAKTVTQLMPSLTISEEYSDNYLKTTSNKQDEFITSYKLGFSVGFLNKTSKIYLSYDPEYKDYREFDDRDRLQHNVSLTGDFQPTKFTDIQAKLSYVGNSEKLAGESWENSALISGSTQLTKHTSLSYSESYSNSFDEQLRTGNFLEHNVNTTKLGLSNTYGKNNTRGLNFSYSFDSYADSNADEYVKLNPSGFLTHWITPLNGLDFNLDYTKTDFDNSTKDINAYTGHVRYLRKFTKHFDGYIKYRHSYSERESGDHHVFHPSVGFDWEITKDSGISLGIGVLINEWDNANEDSTDPFLDINAYKNINFSKRGSLSITGSSGYSDSGDDAASLGYTTFYKAGAQLNYQLQKRLSSNLFGSYTLDEFHEVSVNRKDSNVSIGGGLSWTALKWLKFALTYSFTDFNTDAGPRGDYAENKIFLSVSFIPATPVRFDASPTRQALEKDIFNN